MNDAPDIPRFSNVKGLLLLAFCLLLGGFLSVAMGQPMLWDDQHYHFYNGYALLHQRWNTDFFPAGFHSFFHPLLDVPYALLAYEWFPKSPLSVAFLMGLPAGFFLFLTIYCISRILALYAELRGGYLFFYTILLSIFGISGFPFLVQIGTGTNELPVACLILGAIATLIHFHKRFLTAVTLTGALLGAAAGLKLTALLYAAPFLLGLLFLAPIRSSRLKIILLFSFTWWIAFIALYGWWGLHLYNQTGNPFFPVLNNLFASDLLPKENVHFDLLLFRPRGLRMSLFYPFYWMESNYSSIEGEHDSADPRLLFTQITLGIFILFTVFRKIFKQNRIGKNNPATKNKPTSRFLWFLLVFSILTYIFWEIQFSVLRYLVAIETLSGLLIALCLFEFFDQRKTINNHIFTSAILLFITFVSISTITPKHYFREHAAFSKTFFDAKIPKLPEHTLVLLTPGTSLLAPLLLQENPTLSFVGLQANPIYDGLENSGLGKKIKGKIRHHSGPVCAISSGYERGFPSQYVFSDTFSISPQFEMIETNITSPFKIWPYTLWHVTRKSEQSRNDEENKQKFIQQTMRETENRFTHDNECLFEYGAWLKEKGKDKDLRWLGFTHSNLLFFVKNKDKSPETISIQGFPNGEQNTTLKLNGTILFSGKIPSDGFQRLKIPDGLLLHADQGANRLEFLWPDSRPPGNGDNRRVAFAFKELSLE